MTAKLQLQPYLKIPLVFYLFTVLVSCGGGGSKKSSDPINSTLSSTSTSSATTSSSSSVSSISTLSAQILFPPPVSLTEGNSVLVRGTAINTQGKISSLKVNGITATTADNYANWQARVALNAGMNTLAVDINNTPSNAVAAKITSTARMHRPISIAIDNANNQALVIDETLKGVIAVDLTNGIRKVLSNNGTNLRAIDLFHSPDGIVIDSAHNRALVTDNTLHSVVAVDLTSGVHTQFAYGFGTFAGITIDTPKNRVLVVDNSFNYPAIIALDLTSGVRTVLSDNLIPNTDNRFFSIKGITLDALNNRALVIDFYRDAIVAVNLSTGARTVLSNNTTPNAENAFFSPSSITLDGANNRALVMDGDNIFAVDLNTGARAIFSNNTTLKGINTQSNPSTAITLDNAHNRALVTTRDLHSVIAVDLSNGARTVFSGYHIPNSDNFVSAPKSIALDRTHNRVFVADTSSIASLFAVDLNTATCTILSNYLNPNGVNNLQYPEDVALDIAHNRALIIDSSIQAIIAVDLNNGARTVVSSNTTPNVINPFSRPIAITIDSTHNNALVMDANLNALIAVNLTTGIRTVLSSNAIPNATNIFSRPNDITLDITRNRALVIDVNLEAVIAVDLTTGNRTMLSNNLAPKNITPQFNSPYYITLDNTHNRALVSNFNGSEVIAVDLTSGVRTSISGYLMPDDINNGLNSQSMAIDEVRDIAWTIYGGEYGQGIMAIDLLTGARVYVSR